MFWSAHIEGEAEVQLREGLDVADVGGCAAQLQEAEGEHAPRTAPHRMASQGLLLNVIEPAGAVGEHDQYCFRAGAAPTGRWVVSGAGGG